MIEVADNFMQCLQAATMLGDIYSADHPAVREQERKSLELIRQIHSSQSEVTFVALEDRVVLQNSRLPSSSMLAEGIVRKMRRRGVDSVTFTSGVTLEEVQFFVAELRRQCADEPFTALRHIRPGLIRTVKAVSGSTGGGRELRSHMQAVRSMWAQVQNNQAMTEDLAGVLIEICRAVGSIGGASLPLASLKSHSEYTFVHTLNVGVLSAALARAVGLNADDVHEITIAALLHDIGKQAVPSSVLEKNSQLTPDELKVIQRHPIDGASMLLGSKNVPAIASIVAFEHHLSLDGSGYPAVPFGWRAHPASQLVQVADIFDALRTNRPYRAALSTDEALQIMCDMTDKRMDPSLLGVFIDRVARLADHGEAA